MHMALKKSSGHKSRHIFKFHIFHTRHRTKNRYPFLHKILSLLTEQDEFDTVLANPGCHTRPVFSSKRTKSAPLLFLYAFLQSSFACIYCHMRKNVLNMGGGG